MMKYIEISKNAILTFSGLKVPFWSGLGWFGIEITKSMECEGELDETWIFARGSLLKPGDPYF